MNIVELTSKRLDAVHKVKSQITTLLDMKLNY